MVQFRARQWLVTYDSFFDLLPSLPEITGVTCWLRRSGRLGEVGGKKLMFAYFTLIQRHMNRVVLASK